MDRRGFLKSIAAAAATAGTLGSAVAVNERKPNIVIILADDQGYADASFNPAHPPEVHTPHMDALARSGVICTNGYASGHVCSPTRAGLMTGLHQQRFGIYTAGQGGSGVPLDQKMFPLHLKPAGYVSGAFGKWHMGLTLEYNAINRGFDYFYGFMGRGAHDYFNLRRDYTGPFGTPLYRGLEQIDDNGYLTTRITEEAVAFIERNKNRPFFAYVAYNAVHAPPEAPEEDIKLFNTGDKTRDTLMAMLKHLDLGVGKIIETLKKVGVYENTLVFYLGDNGGAKVMHANNAPLRGFKQDDYEGGIRVPFVVSWPGRIKPGTTCSVPVWSIDILPTVLAATGLKPLPGTHPFDGKNMLPALDGRVDKLHDHLFWSSGDEGKWAVRSGDWKLVFFRGRKELFNLRDDLGETTDLSKTKPEKVKELTDLYNAWLEEMADPVDPKASKYWKPDAPAPRKKLSKEEKAKRRAKQRKN
ncbi:MAG: sulfatase-like hydrolase/transferase [Candidatus Hydrogenedentes bacterium]|nr:sulfatase-like hydrolase/transferase [Candidatus Hydrogenedentota bacterium]